MTSVMPINTSGRESTCPCSGTANGQVTPANGLPLATPRRKVRRRAPTGAVAQRTVTTATGRFLPCRTRRPRWRNRRGRRPRAQLPSATRDPPAISDITRFPSPAMANSLRAHRLLWQPLISPPVRGEPPVRGGSRARAQTSPSATRSIRRAEASPSVMGLSATPPYFAS